MSSRQRDYDSTVARMAGNIAAGYGPDIPFDAVVKLSVKMARAIVAEVKRTEPQGEFAREESVFKRPFPPSQLAEVWKAQIREDAGESQS